MTDNEIRFSHLRPAEVTSRLRNYPVIYLPLGPLEWHGPHLPFGTDPLIAQAVARQVCERIGGIVWPTLFWGTERERDPQTLENLGFSRDEYIVGMDFPANTLPSAYCREETFAILVREALEQIARTGAKCAVLVNGHGAVNQVEVLRRLTKEFNHRSELRVLVGLVGSQDSASSGSGAHAASGETNAMLHLHPDSVDLSQLPPIETPIRYQDFAIVDGPGFDGTGSPDKIVTEDPRANPSADAGRESCQGAVELICKQVKKLLK